MSRSIHCPIESFEFLSENPKLMQRRIASGSMPPPSSDCQMPAPNQNN